MTDDTLDTTPPTSADNVIASASAPTDPGALSAAAVTESPVIDPPVLPADPAMPEELPPETPVETVATTPNLDPAVEVAEGPTEIEVPPVYDLPETISVEDRLAALERLVFYWADIHAWPIPDGLPGQDD